MKTIVFVLAALAVAVTPPAMAEDCKAIKDSAARLACFDKAAGETPAAQAAPAPAPAAQKDAPVAPAPEPPAKTFKVVDVADLYVGPNKYAGRDIEVRNLKCYFADKDDYRCIAPGAVHVAIFSKTVEPALARQWMEDKCDQIRTAVTSSRCTFHLRFTYSADDFENDVVSGMQQRVVITPPAGVTMVTLTSEKRSRR